MSTSPTSPIASLQSGSTRAALEPSHDADEHIGRPPKLTPERFDIILTALRGGLTKRAAAALAGIGEATLHHWVARGEERDPHGRAAHPRYVEFAHAVRKADAEFQGFALTQIIAAAKKPNHWPAAAWLLERKFPHEWGRHERLEVSGPDGGPIPVEALTPEQIRQRIADAEKYLITGETIEGELVADARDSDPTP